MLRTEIPGSLYGLLALQLEDLKQLSIVYCKEVLPELFFVVLAPVRCHTFLQQGGVPSYYRRCEPGIHKHWIERSDPITWPPKSSDLSPLKGYFTAHGFLCNYGSSRRSLPPLQVCTWHSRIPCINITSVFTLVVQPVSAIYLNTAIVMAVKLRWLVACAFELQGCCQVIYSQFGLAIHQNDHQARRRFVEWAQNEIAVVPDFHKRILFSDEAHFWLNGYVNKQNSRIWSEVNPQVYDETPLHPEKLTVWCALWAGGILARATIDLLKDTFGDRLISRFGPVNWPPRSSYLTPLDYFLWGYVKSLVYADKSQTLDHLEDNIRRVTDDIRPQMLEKVIGNWTSRLDYIRARRGSHMPEIIFKM
ncbi:DUF4817 domain-containing protein [Trichonephila clavipes]|nr:DUF4817 domain-containing protein [Trichonephila clavipes]